MQSFLLKIAEIALVLAIFKLEYGAFAGVTCRAWLD
jgi:hypothetical protein